MELRHLRYFIAVAEELHFGRAAQVLGISQPPLSQQIQALEQEIGARLFERTNRRVELSEAGRLFLQEARLVLAQVDKAADVARRAQLGELGELKIGFTSSAPFNSSIPQAIFAFRQAFAAVHLNLQEMSSTEVAESLVDESIQVGLMRPLPLPDSLSVVELMREPLVAVLNAGHPLVEGSERGLHLAQLAEEPFVFFPRTYGSGLYAQLLNLARDAGFSPHFAQEAGEAMTIIGLVAAGLGVSVLPASYQRIRIDGVVYRTLLDQEAVTAVWLVQRKGQQTPMAKAFVELLVASGQ
ncbi:LysR family transcriptional regulator [Pseudomonas yamanorum]|jgi:DNA-binding transcriptional LysR family regulator|uniref:LysR family transcriptional regulator n=1 Tax=Pseudomonas yamanorum TaxID=515393 RepID=A0A7Y8JN73_9PSED|nr:MULTISPECIES: LysR family transcriptional regulator [Pseudomonas]MCS3415692.1 DNA-binding transcriptional LysR family regulator [Pseudomonas sp. BIGb0558]MCS3434901.1 DNA-binding transcriptional LysR family regulator [Pseudomonas sp. BIGb0450]NWE12092.1 LysR family transcriptional regulator [Pseudomonas yamanorum]NWE38171.1 LysR family transcriptional regulator [Pseudomonas yamanorum]NWE76851.1 LysR family transcriptional regulator [Pseudomonas yamanorum]